MLCFAIFGKKISKIPKNGGHFWGFSKFFAKNGKTQICFYLLRYPVRDRAISAKSLYLDTVTGVSNQMQSFAILGKIFSKIPKNGGHFWGFLPKIFAKLQICFYLLRYPVRDRAISSKSLDLARLRSI